MSVSTSAALPFRSSSLLNTADTSACAPATMPHTESLTVGREWLVEVEQNLRAVEIIGKKLASERVTCCSPGTELVLISQEAKLIRHISRVFVLNAVNKGTHFPALYEWLRCVNISSSEALALLERIHTVPELAALNDKQILDLCETLRFSLESRRRLRKSSYSLKRYILRWQADGIEPVRVFADKDLAWMSFDRSTPDRSCASESAADSGASDSGSAVGSNVSQSSLPTCTPPPSPGIMLTAAPATHTGSRTAKIGSTSRPTEVILEARGFVPSNSDRLIRSHSHESNLQYGLSPNGSPSSQSANPSLTTSRSINDCLSVANRVSTLSPPSPLSLHSHPTNANYGSLPKSPKTGRAMHSIPHQWHRRKAFRIAAENCHFCQRQLNFFCEYEKCKCCKWKVHPQCKANIGDSCGLTPVYLKEVLKEMFLKDSGQDGWTPTMHPSNSQQTFAFDSVDSSSSTNSSAPSTPAFPAIHSATFAPSSSPFLLPPVASATFRSNFDFPESVPEVPDIVVDSAHSDPQQRLVSSQGSDCTVRSECAAGPASSEGTITTDSVGSSHGPTTDAQDEVATEQHDHQENQQLSPNSCALNRDRWSNGTIRMPNSWNDVTIPFSQIEFKKQSLIGKGRFGEVHKANWYGDVAVKLLNMDHVDEEKQLDAFKAEVASFKNTRHDNIVLFMGYCLDQHKLGIVMYYCKGRPLHRLLHDMPEKFDFAQIVHLATQTCHGVSYLHTKKIIHKDLRTKNIFIENRNRVVITDFGLFSMKRLAQPSRNRTLIVPNHWLCYLAPELIKIISAELIQLPFTESTDVFAFGTIWFELMTYDFPFGRCSSDSIIWQVGRGIRGPLSNVNAAREVKDILTRCWAFSPSDRPSFRELCELLERLPKKRPNRSPSFPVSRSYESMF